MTATPIYDQTLHDWSLRPDPPTRPLGAVHVVPRLHTVCPICGDILESVADSPCSCPPMFTGSGRYLVTNRQYRQRSIIRGRAALTTTKD